MFWRLILSDMVGLGCGAAIVVVIVWAGPSRPSIAVCMGLYAMMILTFSCESAVVDRACEDRARTYHALTGTPSQSLALLTLRALAWTLVLRTFRRLVR